MENGKNPVANHQDCSYLTLNTVDWIDIFIRPVYKQIVADALNYFISTKGFTVYAWCLMTNHLHLIARAKDGSGLAMFEREFKKFTTTRILEAIDLEPELRSDWMLHRFELFSRHLKRNEKFQLWQNCSNPSFIDFKQIYKLQERVLYIHENPVRDHIVETPEHYLYSSARDYAGGKGPVNVSVINFDQLRIGLLKSNGNV